MEGKDELAWMPGHEIARRIAAKEFSPVEVTQYFLERAARIDPYIHSFITVCGDEALAQARAAEQAVMKGALLGPLHGVPLAIKDEAWIKGVRCTAGSRLFEDFVPDEDGTAMRRLRAAGAIFLGKTNTPEFMGWGRTANDLMPETVNPWDLRRGCGASSGGTGAALAAGLSPAGLGSDGGGSIRLPAAACGVVGLFPTPGRIPDTGSFSYAHCGSMGPMARDVRDVAALYAAMAGPDGQDYRQVPPLRDVFEVLEQGVAGMRFAFTPDFGYIDLQPGLGEAVRKAARLLEGSGAHVDEPGIVFPDAWEWVVNIINGTALYSGNPKPYLMTDEFQAWRMQPENYVRMTEYGRGIADGRQVSREAYEDAVTRTNALKRQFEELFERYDAVLSPTLPVTAPILPPGRADPYPVFCCGLFFTAVANIAGLPALAYPCGLLDGLPVSLQIIGPRGREDSVLRIARALEQALPFTAHPSLGFAQA